jgi:hypothetical protein
LGAKDARENYKIEKLNEIIRLKDQATATKDIIKLESVDLPKALKAGADARRKLAEESTALLLGTFASQGKTITPAQQQEVLARNLDKVGLNKEAKEARSVNEANKALGAGALKPFGPKLEEAKGTKSVADQYADSVLGGMLTGYKGFQEFAAKQAVEVPVELRIPKDQKDFAELLFGSQLAAKVVSTGTTNNTNTPPTGTIPNRRASGGRAYGDTLVGEHGPELVRFNRPGHVYTAAETSAMMNRSNPASNVDNSRVVHVGQIVTPAARTETASRALLTQLVRGF